jgi:DNA-binding transcriptional LysR family regulator
MTTIDLGKIATFVRVVETESFTAAAEALGLPKSSVSRSVARLEEELGVRLLQRTTRRLGLTEAGAAFYQSVRSALSAVDEAVSAAADLGTEPRGLVRLTAPVDLGDFLADPLTRFSKKYPQIQLDVVLTARVVDMVREGFDLALRASRLVDSTLVARKIGTFAHGLFAAPAYLKKRGVPRTLAELASHDCVLFRARGRMILTLRGPRGDEQVEVTGNLATDDLTFVISTAAAGAGVAYLPLTLAARAVADKRLVRVLPDYAWVHSDLSLVIPSGRYIPSRVSLLRDFLAAELKQLVPPCPGGHH